MKLFRVIISLCLCVLLTGCASLLEREYSTAEPHSSKFWESEAASTLRAEDYQDIVNDLLLLVSRHTETATIRLYDFEDEAQVIENLEQAAREVQLETPMGAYAVEYITSAGQAQRGYYETSVQIGYRRTAEQIQSVVNATSTGAVTALLEGALENGNTELAVRISYWGSDGQAEVETLAAQLRQDRGLTEETPWIINFYPAEGTVGLVEFLMEPDQQPEETWTKSVKVPRDQLPEETEQETVPGEGEEAGEAVPAEGTSAKPVDDSAEITAENTEKTAGTGENRQKAAAEVSIQKPTKNS